MEHDPKTVSVETDFTLSVTNDLSCLEVIALGQDKLECKLEVNLHAFLFGNFLLIAFEVVTAD